MKYIIKYEFDTRYDSPYWASTDDINGHPIMRCGTSFEQARARLIVALKEVVEYTNSTPPPDEEVEI